MSIPMITITSMVDIRLHTLTGGILDIKGEEPTEAAVGFAVAARAANCKVEGDDVDALGDEPKKTEPPVADLVLAMESIKDTGDLSLIKTDGYPTHKALKAQGAEGYSKETIKSTWDSLNG